MRHMQVRAIREQPWQYKRKAEGEKWYTQRGSQSAGNKERERERQTKAQRKKVMGPGERPEPSVCVWPHSGKPQFQLFPHMPLASVSQDVG